MFRARSRKYRAMRDQNNMRSPGYTKLRTGGSYARTHLRRVGTYRSFGRTARRYFPLASGRHNNVRVHNGTSLPVVAVYDAYGHAKNSNRIGLARVANRVPSLRRTHLVNDH